jgi:hypothetical protein
MSFRFEVQDIHRLKRARVAILEGAVLEGAIPPDTPARLIQQGGAVPLHIKSVVLWSAKSTLPDTISITLALQEPAVELVQIGDIITS